MLFLDVCSAARQTKRKKTDTEPPARARSHDHVPAGEDRPRDDENPTELAAAATAPGCRAC